MPVNYNEAWFAKSDCGSKCRSVNCVKELNAVITKANILQCKDYVWSRCPSSCVRHDIYGIYPLHMASSCGKIEILDWLISTFQCDLNVQDEESGWTALHRAVYYGRLACAILLIEYGANMWIRDKDGLTAMDISMMDCTPWVKSLEFSRQTYEMPCVLSVADPLEVYTWGVNDNFILGHGNPRGGKLPEAVEYFTRKKINIKQVEMAKFHTVFLAVDGTVYTCGHGEGGRLGNGQQAVCLEPTAVSLGQTVKITSVSAAVNHTLFVTDIGQVYGCGLNKYHVLGGASSNDRELSPVRIHGPLRSAKVVGCASGRLHSVVWTDNHAVFTFGTNAGQLGHSKADLYIKKPRQVSGVYSEEDKIASVHACDSATVVATSQGTVYLLQNYVCRKIISKQLDIEKVQVGGGRLDTSALTQVDQRLHATHSLIKDESLRVLLRKKSGDVLSWSKAHGTLDRCRFSVKQPLLIKDIALCNHGHTALLITNGGQAFMTKFGHWKAPKPPKRYSSSSMSKGYDSCLDMLDADAVQELVLEQVSGVFRANSGTLSPKGKTGALLQCEPCNFITDIPMIPESAMAQDMDVLFREMHENDGICDLKLIATDANGNKLVTRPCHKYVVCSKSPKLRKMIQGKLEYLNDDNSLDAIVFRECDPVVLKNMVRFIYSEKCDLLRDGFKPQRLTPDTHSNDVSVSWYNAVSNCKETDSTEPKPVDGKISALSAYQNQPKSSKKSSMKTKRGTRNVLSQFKSLAKSLGVNRSLFDCFFYDEGTVSKKSKVAKCSNALSFDRYKMRELYDIKLECSDGVVLEAHKCVLVARVEFFRSMLFSRWAETESSLSKVPIDSKVFGRVLDYVYADKADVLDDVESMEMLCDVMAAADQMLLGRLKDVAQAKVASMLTLKNVAAIMEFSSAFNCEQLFATCQQFVCHNLPSLMNTPLFYSVDYKTLEDCNEFYRSNINYVFLRTITPSSEAPHLPEIESDEISVPQSPIYEPMSPFDSFNTGQQGSSPKKRQNTPRRKSVGAKRKSLSKHDGVTLSELLARKEENRDSLMSRITATANVKPDKLEPSSKDILEDLKVEKFKIEKCDKPCQKTTSKVPESVTNGNRSKSPKMEPTSPNGKNCYAGPSLREIMASQARNVPLKTPVTTPTQGTVWAARSSADVVRQSPAKLVSVKPKKLSQKERKRLAQEASLKDSAEKATPNPWGAPAANRPPSSNQSFSIVMKGQSFPSTPLEARGGMLNNKRVQKY